MENIGDKENQTRIVGVEIQDADH